MNPTLPRRDILAGAAAGLTGGAGLHALLPDATTAPARAPSDASDTVEDADPIPEDATPYAVYQYVPVLGEFRPSLPINVVAPLEAATFDDLVAVFEDARWDHRPAENARYAYDRATDSWVRAHWSGSTGLYGVVPRLHVRCWAFSGVASIQAHVDTPPSPHHRIRSFASAANGVANLFRRAGWTVDGETRSLGNAQSPDHDGEALVVRA